jgi:DNA repair protein RadC
MHISISLFFVINFADLLMKPYEQRLCIKLWAEADRPREKLLLNGRRHLTDAELIAILIGSGNKDETAVDLSKRILSSYENDLNLLGKVSVQDLSKFKGIGEAKAISIVAALELGRRRKDADTGPIFKITSSKDAFHALYPVFADLNNEEFWILTLNRANHITGKHLVSKGGVSGTVADPKVIFKIGLEHNAVNIILAHNHPSGNLKPSHQDLTLTKRLTDAGKMLDMNVLDHLIFASRSYFSFGDEGLI